MTKEQIEKNRKMNDVEVSYVEQDDGESNSKLFNIFMYFVVFLILVGVATIFVGIKVSIIDTAKENCRRSAILEEYEHMGTFDIGSDTEHIYSVSEEFPLEKIVIKDGNPQNMLLKQDDNGNFILEYKDYDSAEPIPVIVGDENKVVSYSINKTKGILPSFLTRDYVSVAYMKEETYNKCVEEMMPYATRDIHLE